MGLTNNTGKLSNTLTSNGTQITLGGSTVTDGNLLNIIGNQSSVNVGLVLNNTNGTYPKIYGLQNVNNNFVLYDYSASATRLTISSSGAATFSSSVKSDGVSSEGKFIIERDSVATNTIIGSLDFTNNNAVTTYGKVFGGRNSGGDGYVALGTGVSNNLYALETGNVGIGTSSPGYLLDVNGTGRFNGKITSTVGNNNLILENTSATTGWIQPLRILNTGGHLGLWVEDSSGNNRASGSSAYAGGLCTYTSTALQFGTNNVIRMSITSGGYIKASPTGTYFGAALPYHELINNTTYPTLLVQATSTSFDDRALMVYATRNTTNNSFYAYGYYNVTAAAYKFLVADSGNVTNTNNSYGAISDIKLKENITDATPKLDDLLKVKIKNYNYIGSEEKQLGVIAQELEEVFPSMIEQHEDYEEIEITDEEGNITKEKQSLGTFTKSVKYSVFVPMLIKAIQELSAKVSALENK